MEYMNALKKEIYTVLTDNGDTAYRTTGSYCLDFFSLVGGMRNNNRESLNLFIKAFYEDSLIAIKLLFFTRDIRNGLGERKIFRVIFNYLCNFNQDIAEQIITYIPKYGRWDDVLAAIQTPCEGKMIEVIKEQLQMDIENNKKSENISLLCKWLPSINASSSETRKMAKKLCKYLEMTEEEYRKTLVSLRKGRIIENNLRVKDYSFDYEKQPSQAMFKYRQAFINNDYDRYNQFLEDVSNGNKKIATNVLYPYQVVNQITNCFYSRKKEDKSWYLSLDSTWKSFDRKSIDSKTIVVRDGSGSMHDGRIPSANDIATSLAILFAEQLQGPFKNNFITFSASPRLVKLNGNDIYQVVTNVLLEDEITNTDISKVYELLYNVAKNNNLSQKEMIERIVIISDMEFDCCVYGQSTYETFKDKYSSLGYKMPEVVFWNVSARKTHVPVKLGTDNVKLVSGSSNKIIDMVMNNKDLSAYDFMIECLERYSELNTIKI